MYILVSVESACLTALAAESPTDHKSNIQSGKSDHTVALVYVVGRHNVAAKLFMTKLL